MAVRYQEPGRHANFNCAIRYREQGWVRGARERSLRQRLGNPVEPIIDGRDLVLQRFDLSTGGRVERTDGVPHSGHLIIVSFLFWPRGVNGASSKPCHRI